MLSPGELEEIPERFRKIMDDLELNILTDIVMRIKKNGKFTSQADYMLNKLAELSRFDVDVKNYIAKALKLTEKAINEVYDVSMKESYVRDETLYKATGTEMVPYEKNEPLQQIIQAVKRQTQDTMVNITGTMAFKCSKNGQDVTFGAKQYYENELDSAMTKVLAGTDTIDNVVKNTVHSMAQKGIFNVDYATGTERSISAATRTAVMTGVNQVSDQIDNMNMEKLDTKYVEVSWHIGARNTGIGPMNHQSWQGRCYYYDKDNPMEDSYVDGKLYQSLVRVTGYGSIIGLCGINCRHSKHAFLPGISTPVYSEEQLADMNDIENQTKVWKGKEYNTYQAMQHMRAMERLMRHLRRELKLLKAAGLENDPDYTNMKAKYQGLNQQYSKFAKAMDLQEQRQRVYDDGIRLNNQINIAKSNNPAIIKADKVVTGHEGTPKAYEPNSVVDHIGKDGKVDKRSFYDESCLKSKDIHTTDHNNPKKHPYGNHGEHAHDYEWDKDERLKNKTTRELTDRERKENDDIL